MKHWLCLCVASLVALTGCSGAVKINNNGPNTIQVTANPSPDSPDLPLDIPAGQSGTLYYGFFPPPADIQVADPTSGKFDVEHVGVPDGLTLIIDWDGNQLTVQPLP